MTVIIGLTGGIASGKSVVGQMLAELGALVIDADKVGHEAYARGTGCYDAVVAAFGAEVVGPDGEIDRKALGGKVFGDPAQRRRLESIVWPWMRETMDARLRQLRADGVPVVVLEAAVLIEADWIPLVDQVWLVEVSPEVARERLMARNGLTAEQAAARISAQLSNGERERHAQVIIENGGRLDALRQRVTTAWERLAATASG
ncbi:MAG TPA: dephospho-CoA kinase [Dehalococcoidia bacterium]|nr:dephospho-CoA kinase [Dehalococcoidia bacterium]